MLDSREFRCFCTQYRRSILFKSIAKGFYELFRHPARYESRKRKPGSYIGRAQVWLPVLGYTQTEDGCRRFRRAKDGARRAADRASVGHSPHTRCFTRTFTPWAVTMIESDLVITLPLPLPLPPRTVMRCSGPRPSRPRGGRRSARTAPRSIGEPPHGSQAAASTCISQRALLSKVSPLHTTYIYIYIYTPPCAFSSDPLPRPQCASPIGWSMCSPVTAQNTQ